jgi:hypothetical protein
MGGTVKDINEAAETRILTTLVLEGRGQAPGGLSLEFFHCALFHI